MLKTIVYLIFSLATVFYALPRMQFYSQSLAATIFTMVWLLFAFLVIGAHLDRLFVMDEQKRRQLSQLKKYNMWKKQQQLLKLQPNRSNRVRGTR